MAPLDIMFCEPACGPLTLALRAQLPDSPDVALDPADGTPSAICVVDTGNDAATLTQMAAMLAAQPGSDTPRPQIIAQISDRMLRTAVEARLEQDRIEPRPIVVGAEALIATHVISANPLFKMAFWRDQPRVHVVMIGFGALGRALLEEIVLDGVADGLDAPLIEIMTADASAARAALSQEMPEIQASATINFIDLTTDAWHSPDGPLRQIEAVAPITAIFLLLDESRATLSASAAICELQDRYRVAIAPLFIAGPAVAAALALTTPRRLPRNLAAATTAIGGLGAIEGLLDHILLGRNIVARRIHDAYEARYAKQTAAGTPWSGLAETYRRANRRAARHLSHKLFVLGIDGTDPGRAHLVSPMTFERLIRPLVQSSVEDDTVRRLARLEHDRWCADRRVDGWVHGHSRDEQRRRHPSLIPFDDPRLTAEEIDKDIAQLRFLLGSVVIPDDDGPSVRLTIGILEHSGGDQPGIAGEAIRQRFDDEPDRDIVLLSPLLTPAEFSATWALVDHLDGQSRNFRLYIPQQQADGDSARPQLLASQGRFDALLARQGTYVVPIGPADAAGDDWENMAPGVDAPSAVAAYVVKRSDALLNPCLSPWRQDPRA